MSDSLFEDCCDQFEASWQAGKPLKIRSLLERSPASRRNELLKALLEIELEYRFAAGEEPDPGDYPFPGQDAMVALAFATTRRRLDLPHRVYVSATDDEATQEALGPSERTIGPYELLRKIAEDEIGAVYLAEQQQPLRRRVALKIIRSLQDHAEVLRRFDNERQALAMMDHPNVAKVLDADTAHPGRPFFVTELVRGIPITTFCDRHKLNMKKRLQLFIQSCDAIEHGHEKGILHLDIHPHNVLIEQRDRLPTVRVLHFGLARALGGNPWTGEEAGGTPVDPVDGAVQYMSPEHWERNTLDLDARSDVYSLGVLLYELLTGTTPIQAESFKGMTLDRYQAAFRAEETPRPSLRLKTIGNLATEIADRRKTDPKTLRRLLRGDLDEIAGKALAKTPDRRYGRAGDLAEDVRSFLATRSNHAKAPRLLSRQMASDTKERRAIDVTRAEDSLGKSGDFSWEPDSFDGVLSPPQTADEIGRLGDFQIQKLLGAGGMGFVFLANTVGSNAPIALKVMKPAVARISNAKRRFLREAHATRTLKHPNIVSIYELGDIDGTPYITMEYLQGQTLQSAMEQCKTFTQERLIQFAREIASGLAFAHSRDLVHRDIKPGNLWIAAPSGSIKILDFGLVRDVSQEHVSLTETGVVVGSPKYMSPEQTRGEKVGPPSDLFSLGSILYRLATGKSAFDGKNVTSTLLSIANDDPVSVSQIRPELHYEFASLIHRLLEKKPQDRPASASDVYDFLVQLESQTNAKPPVSHSKVAGREGLKD